MEPNEQNPHDSYPWNKQSETKAESVGISVCLRHTEFTYLLLELGYDNLLASCDLGDPANNPLNSVHPYFELHGAPASHPRALRLGVKVSGHVSGHESAEKERLRSQLERGKNTVKKTNLNFSSNK